MSAHDLLQAAAQLSALPMGSRLRHWGHTFRQAWRSLGEHAGLWSPGVRLLRNYSMARKTMMVAVVVALPLALLVNDAVQLWQERYRATQRAVAGHAEFAALAAYNAGLLEMQRLMFAREQGRPHATLPQARAVEAKLFQALQAAFDADTVMAPSVEAALSGLLRRLMASHEQMLARVDDNTPPAVPGAPAPRWQAVQAHQRDLDALRALLSNDWSVVIDSDVGNKMLRTGVVDPNFQIMANLSRLGGLGVRLYREKVLDARVKDVTMLLAKTDLLLEQSQPKVEYVLTHQLADRAKLEQQLQVVRAFLRKVEKLVQAAPTANSGSELAQLADLDPQTYMLSAVDAINASVAVQQVGIQAIGERVFQERSRQNQTLLWRACLFLAVGLLGGYLLVCFYKVLSGGLATLCAQLDELGKGNLSIRPRGWGNDEIGHALSTLGSSMARMSSLFEAVTQGVSAVSHASREVAVGNAGLSTRTGTIKRSIDEVTERAQGFSGAMDRCAVEVEQAAEHVRSMRAEAQRSRKAMASLRERMRVLQSKSREITRVVGLVETVAFQTKLLSLNASVEAARAGTAGRGFSVVAQEVRALAQRSEDAARKIHGIVSGSVTEIEEGSVMTERASKAVAHTDEEIQAVDRIMNDIVRLTRDSMRQSQEVLGIARDVEQSVGCNAELVSQLSEASGALRNQGDSLKRSVHHFVLR